MSGDHAKNPLHGITLERMLTEMVDHFGWETMGDRINIGCFTSDPSIKSSLKFLRKTPWARTRVEGMYLFMLREKARKVKQQTAATSIDDSIEVAAAVSDTVSNVSHNASQPPSDLS